MNAPIVTQDTRERAYVTRRAGALARRPCVSQRRDARLSALHRDDFGSGAVLPSRAFPPDPCSDAPRSQVVLPGGRGPETSRDSSYELKSRDATPCSAFRIVSGDAPHEQECKSSSIATS